jgi:hypothetical protein
VVLLPACTLGLHAKGVALFGVIAQSFYGKRVFEALEGGNRLS